ncbi:hypothetical protein COCSUDRAFT_32491 [Coccomyxa subellipsoidea C-169]|uniref:Uncharacterized protein n=1 Tax=Coccomyxa subellipsoidea (strain C-169) TaxID=574566 RepID=I0Z648_COCSC|nr:hypothetical protein COCSUDRAFT_32491 [Coccomyxa subellipsoidea C-169]EIE26117.1 hypothetical protein COCSUDRAFT_32491 [Coccomyxa subellipsoidea C-169]|eukprot:XP_005650661.1 hypothetical protein COCSUDRAFT_32491 [Coccomyxa subellipsoidea C-169]
MHDRTSVGAAHPAKQDQDPSQHSLIHNLTHTYACAQQARSEWIRDFTPWSSQPHIIDPPSSWACNVATLTT